MAQVQLDALVREGRGKGAARRTRRSGFVPAVLYGGDRNATALQVPTKDIELFLQRGAWRLLELQLDKAVGGSKKRRTAIVKDVQTDPTKGEILHVDFQAVSMDQEVTTIAPVRIVGEEDRPNDGGIVTVSLRELDVACPANAIPEYIEVDVSNLAAGENLTIADLKPAEEVRLLATPDEVVVSVLEQSRAAEAGAEEDADEPEVGDSDQETASDAS